MAFWADTFERDILLTAAKESTSDSSVIVTMRVCSSSIQWYTVQHFEDRLWHYGNEPLQNNKSNIKTNTHTHTHKGGGGVG